MEKISGSALGSVRQAVKPGSAEKEVSSAYSEEGDAIHIEITVPNDFDPQNIVLFSMIMPRTLFLMGRDRVVSFSIGNTVGSVAIALAVFMLLGYFLTRPFMKLNKDVQSIDMSKKVFDMLPEDVFVIINEFTRETVASPIRRAFELDQIVELQNHTLLIAKDGREVPIEDTASPIRDMHGDVIGCVLVFRDFSERKEKQRRIEYLS